ncbi:GGDEF domain-containing protein [Sagittula salina]|uniref:diguanylate cyclase n=1 Tax=Sagittula salina TaxID=2820268 RepID=A0A940MIW7_9RHOB|nr:GGDEF domain-containing protein [Sagittula salina]
MPAPRHLSARHAPNPAIRRAEHLRRTGLWATAIAIVLIALDYFTDWQVLLSPIDHSVRTNPFTLVAVGLAAVALLRQRPMQAPTGFVTGCWLGVLGIAALFPLSGPVTHAISPDGNLGRTGWNTALALALIAAGQLAHRLHPRQATHLILAAIVPALVALNGIALGAAEFHGEMSMTSALALGGLWLASLRRIARERPLRLILPDNRPGRLLRRQVGLWLAMDLGLLLVLRAFELQGAAVYPAVHSFQMLLTWMLSFYFSMEFAGLLDTAQRGQTRLRGEAERDHLTGLATRRAAERHYRQISARAQRFTVVLIDIDNFKRINDRYGHACGDEALAAMAETIRARLRVSDFAARWGGEEFLVFLHGVPTDSGTLWAADLQDALDRRGSLVPGLPMLTVSVGITAHYGAPTPPLDQLVRHADEALYAAKEDGRDCAWFADPEDGYRLRRTTPRPAAKLSPATVSA